MRNKKHRTKKQKQTNRVVQTDSTLGECKQLNQAGSPKANIYVTKKKNKSNTQTPLK